MKNKKEWSAHVELATLYQCFDTIAYTYRSSYITTVRADSDGDVVLSGDGG